MVEKTYPKKYSGELSVDYLDCEGGVSNFVDIGGDSLVVSARKIELEEDTVWFYHRNGTSLGFAYLPEHVARRVAIDAKHHGIEVDGL